LGVDGGLWKVARRQVVFAEAVVSEAKVDTRLDQVWVERQHFTELFLGLREFPLP